MDGLKTAAMSGQRIPASPSAAAEPGRSSRVRNFELAGRVFAVLGIFISCGASLPSARASQCGAAARAAEQAAGLPTGLLGSIGHVESGGASGLAWTVNDGRQGRHFANREDAEAYAASILSSGQQMIDLGCFQIDLFYHPDAFTDWQEAFDPAANAAAAAAILKELHDRTGSWDEAISLYHSADPSRGLPYMDKVLQAWSMDFPDAGKTNDGAAVTDRFTILMSADARAIPVWGPGSALVSLHYKGRHLQRLPAVITP